LLLDLCEIEGCCYYQWLLPLLRLVDVSSSSTIYSVAW
jgi:hypothetical protein